MASVKDYEIDWLAMSLARVGHAHGLKRSHIAADSAEKGESGTSVDGSKITGESGFRQSREKEHDGSARNIG